VTPVVKVGDATLVSYRGEEISSVISAFAGVADKQRQTKGIRNLHGCCCQRGQCGNCCFCVVVVPVSRRAKSRASSLSPRTRLSDESQ
jgi:hypothetical protein